MTTYIILGYGVPGDIMLDDNYRRYLGVAFNAMYQESHGQEAKVVFCGGKTDIRKPYKRSEAKEMGRLVGTWMKEPARRQATRPWSVAYEQSSLSTVESLVAVRKLARGRVMIFCEATRAKRVKALAKEILGKSAGVCSIDFDLSPNRYLDPAFIADKEAKTLKIERWALQNPKQMKQYRQALQERIEHFRRVGPQAHLQAIQEWWQTKLDDLAALSA